MKYLRITGAALLLAILISGCGNKEEDGQSAVPPDNKPTATAEPTPTDAVKPTGTVTPTEAPEEEIEVTLSNSQDLTADYTTMKDLPVEKGTYIAVVAKGLNSSYWDSVKKGSEIAIKELNQELGYTGNDKVRITFEGPSNNSDVDAQINILDAVLADNPSVLCLSAVDMQSCSAQLETAQENGIPVVIIDSGVENNLIAAACATNNYSAGAEAAKKMSEAIDDSGEVAVMAHQETAQSSIDRVKGFTEEIANNHPGIQIVETSYEDEKKSVKEMAIESFKDHPELSGYFGTNEKMAVGVIDAMGEAKNDTVKVIGFDSGEVQQKAIKDGKEYGMISQNPYGMGYASMVTAARLAAHLPVDTYISSGYQWIDQSSISLPENHQYLYK